MNDLRQALATIHRDPGWWYKMGIGGALTLSLVGYPWADGFLMQSVENSRRGFPSPLPPWNDWGVRYLIGLLGLLIDFALFLVPLLVAGLLLVCVSSVVLVALGSSQLFMLVPAIVLLPSAVYLLAVFGLGLSPIARLIYAEEGRIEDALGRRPLRIALAPATRATLARVRLSSLLAYLPTLLLVTAARLAVDLPGGAWVVLLFVWLAASALLYARLAVMHVYIGTERRLGGLPR